MRLPPLAEPRLPSMLPSAGPVSDLAIELNIVGPLLRSGTRADAACRASITDVNRRALRTDGRGQREARAGEDAVPISIFQKLATAGAPPR